MSRRPFQPDELGPLSTDAGGAVAELEDYAATAAGDVPRGFRDRVMTSIEQEPAPRRSLLGWLLVTPASSAGLGRYARAGALAVALVLAVAGALFAGQLADIVRNVGSGSPTPVMSASPSPTQSESPSPTPLISSEASPSGSPEAPGGAGGSTDGPGAPDSSEHETPEPSGGNLADATEMP